MAQCYKWNCVNRSFHNDLHHPQFVIDDEVAGSPESIKTKIMNENSQITNLIEQCTMFKLLTTGCVDTEPKLYKSHQEGLDQLSQFNCLLYAKVRYIIEESNDYKCPIHDK